MAAEPATAPYPAPYMEFYAPASGGVRVRVINSAGGIEYELDINGATWTAIGTSMGTPGNKYVPKNHNSLSGWNVSGDKAGDGSLNRGGNLSRNWVGAS